MTGKDTCLMFKYLGMIIVVLLTHEYAVETHDFPVTSPVDSEFCGIEGQLYHTKPESTVLSSDYVIEIEVTFFDLFLVNYLQDLVTNISLPFTLSSNLDITDIDMTTVCGLNGTEYECKCEEGHVWPSDTCGAYQVCDSIVGGTCGCIEALPSVGPLCQKVAPTATTAGTTTATTSATTTATATTAVATTEFPVTTSGTTKVLKMSLRLNESFDGSLNDPTELKYQKYANIIMSAIDVSYRNMSDYVKGSVKLIKFRPGSILADYEVNFTSTTGHANNGLKLANIEVFKTLFKEGIILTQNAFSESEQKNLSTADKWYPFQRMMLRCKNPDSNNITMQWMVNEKDPTSDTDRYSISPDTATLTVKNATEKDNGRYSCIIPRDTIPYIQWQTIFLEDRPNIIVGKNEINVQCVDKLVQLTCCEAKYDVEWIPISSGDQVTPQVDGCITLKHKIVGGNCENKTFTCRLKDPVLKDLVYGWKRVTVQKVKGEFSCDNDTLGVGNENEFVTGPCEKDWDGTITYQCTSGIWTEFRRSCVLYVFIHLKRKVETLIVEQIPEFMSELSAATVNFTQETTESPLTVQTIVDILTNINSISQNIIISKSVMEDFLKTVDILVSDKAAASWQSLTKENTSILLLSVIEDVTARLSDGDFTIDKTFIQLNRTVIKNSYTGRSNLPNSTLQILIPQVYEPTSLTIIVFSTLENILPTRDTSKNDYWKSDMHINGDVVVVKVDKTLNISLIFDTINQTLGNPQCVFWNFILDAWDSTGCEVKPINTGNKTGKITCECNHTTSFSILMSPVYINNIALSYITYIGVAISMVCLILCLIIETLVWKTLTRNDTSYMRHVSIVNIAFSHLIANICFIIEASISNEDQSTPVGPCSAAVFFMLFFFLALFFWMLISALLLFYRTVFVLSHMSRAKMMVIAFTVGYGSPLLIAVITVASTAGPQNYVSKRYSCWLNWFESRALLAFVIPALTIVAVNLVVLIVVLYKILSRRVGATMIEKHTLVIIARCVALFTPVFVFGLTWGMGFGTAMSVDFGIHVVFALFNALQALVILLFGMLLDNKVREALSQRNRTCPNCIRIEVN